ncbi:MAG: GNAT family protein, partial [Nonlabens sp.]
LAFERGYDKSFGDSLVSVIHEENIGSIKVALHNGMSLEADYIDSTITDRFLVYSITRKKWEQIKKG